MLGRFFGRLTGGNWRPPEQELRFAAAAGFDTLQIRSDRAGEIEDELGIDAVTLGALFDDIGLEPVLEMLVRHDGERGALARALRANLAAIDGIGVLRVHIHPVGPSEAAALLRDDFAEAVDVAEAAGLILGCEHNAPGHRLLVEPDDVEALLDAVPGLGFVWDVNHTRPEHTARFLALRERFTLVHASDTPLPETNHHLPLGRGTVDFSPLRSLDGVPVILEIGGLPISGGPGFDTDEALLDSLERLRAFEPGSQFEPG
ncbi:MAG: Xylose isomerase domain protein barrel [Actinomycetia bacterium]|nr:Xylose isomerase domain protein barrel [Actinomycetes bacterium]